MAALHVLDHPLAAHKLTRLRDRETGPAEFQALVQELTWLLAVEATRDLPCRPHTVRTPLAEAEGSSVDGDYAIVPVLRAGLGMADPMHQMLPAAAVRHLGIYRDRDTLEPRAYYRKLPEGRPAHTCFLLDPMLATGGTAIAAVACLRAWGATRIRFLGLLGADAGVRALAAADDAVEVWLCGLDRELDDSGYIVPGLGDAGDRQFNTPP